MAVTAEEYKSKIGLDKLYYATITVDSATAYSTGSVTYLAPVATMGVAPTINSETQYADDQAFDTIYAEGSIVLTLEITNLPLETRAALLGKVYDSTNGRLYNTGGEPPYVAFGFRSKKSNGSYVYFWFLKGKFAVTSENMETKGETPAPQLMELTYTGIKTVYEFDTGSPPAHTVDFIMGDDDIAAFDNTSWFSTVQVWEDRAAGPRSFVAATFARITLHMPSYHPQPVRADGVGKASIRGRRRWGRCRPLLPLRETV